MKQTKIFAGDRLRQLRERHALKQAALAGALGISASYLSQIESDERPITPPLLARLADLLGVQSGYFADAEDQRLAGDLREATGDPMLGAGAVSLGEARAAVRAAPEVTQRFLALYRAYLALEEEAERLRGQAVSSPEPDPSSRFPYDEVRDWVQSHRNHFEPLDRAAEALSSERGFGRLSLAEDLPRYLREHHRIEVESVETLPEGMIWRFDRRTRRLLLVEGAPPESRTFWMAHLVGLLEQRAAIDRLVADAQLSSDEAAALARVGLANYFAGALVMPYGRFLDEAEAARYDIERLQARFGVSFEQVCHRLSTMQRRDRPGIPFYFLKSDIAGNVLKRSSATRFQFARFGGPCPLWNVHQAFALPGRILVQLARTPDGATYLCIARTVGPSGGSYRDRPRAVAVGLGCEIEFATRTVYAAGLDLHSPDAADPIGPGCRACDRVDCRHRALPPPGRPLDVGTAERGVIPYRIMARG